MNTIKGQQLYDRAKTLIPGGTQLLSKRPEMFAPGLWPPYYSKAEGCRVWDLDGNEFLDMTTVGIGACLLGYADPTVNAAVIRAIEAGSASTLNSPLEVELAERLVALNPWAGKARFARTGGEALAVAIRIARAHTGRDEVAFCGYHGWHDWYLAANLGGDGSLGDHLLPGLEPLGVPSGLSGTVHGFHYNRLDELDQILAERGGNIGTIIMEPIRYTLPEDDFLAQVRTRANKAGAVLIIDEVTSGFRFAPCGAHAMFGVEPDLAVYAKALGNGFPIGAVVGRDDVMDAAQRTFISSTSWTEQCGFAAAVTTLSELDARNAPAQLEATGMAVQSLWRESSERHGVPITISGLPALSHFAIDLPQAQILSTLLTQEFLGEGILANTAFYANCAHTGADIEIYANTLGSVFATLREAADSGRPEQYLKGPVAHKGFSRLT